MHYITITSANKSNALIYTLNLYMLLLGDKINQTYKKKHRVTKDSSNCINCSVYILNLFIK